MNAVPQSFRLLERITRPAPLGIIFWDFASGMPVRDGLSVSVARAERPESARTLVVNRNAVWLTDRLPGISPADLLADDWSPLRRTYRVTVLDTLGRFLPLQFDAELPSGGLYEWPGWSALPKTPIAPLGKSLPPARPSPDRIPLFSSPGRSGPAARAEVRCQLVDFDTGRPASWALLTAKHKNSVRGIGLADREGRMVLFFGYPERPAPSLAHPPAITDYVWDLTLQAYYDPATGPIPEMADLAVIMAQLSKPRDLLGSTVAPTAPLSNQQLTLGQVLTVRTTTEDGPSSSLFLAPE